MSARSATFGVAAAAAGLVVCLYTGLIAASRWWVDEYYQFGIIRSDPWGYLRSRLWSWSPRPLSELLIEGYAALVAALHRQLVVSVLLACWLALALGIALGLGLRREGRVWRSLIGLSLLALFLLNHPLGDMFYWPVGALAYLPCLAGTAAACLLALETPRQGHGRRIGCAVAMVVAASSAEVGAMLALWLASLLLLIELLAMRAAGAARGSVAGVIVWAVPLLVAVVVLMLLATGRGTLIEMPDGQPRHQVWSSLAAAAQVLGHEIMRSRAPWPGNGVWLGLAAIGWAICLRPAALTPAPMPRLLAVLVATVLAAYTSAAASIYQFGIPCCTRHEAYRACLLVLAALTLAALLACIAAPLVKRLPVALGPALLTVPLLVGLIAHLPALVNDYLMIPATLEVRRANWAAGWAPGSSMRMVQPPEGRIIDFGRMPSSGHFTLAEQPPWYIAAVLRFFGKSEIDVVDRPPG